MDYVLPALVTLLMLAVLLRRQIKQTARRWYGVEETKPPRESLEEALNAQRRKLRERQQANGGGEGLQETQGFAALRPGLA